MGEIDSLKKPPSAAMTAPGSGRIGESRKVWQCDHQDVPAQTSHVLWMPQPPYMAVQSSTTFRNIPYSPSLQPTVLSVRPANTAPQYKAPAHKHAHHLHSIPPREKSTRTLIIDHMLWVHGRTRFAQARAELGMTDRTGGPSSCNYTHRHRPENYEEDDEAGSESEDVSNLKARLDPPNQFGDDAERTRQDLSLARGLRLRAEGLEKVVTSMLDQPPPVHPVVDDDIVAGPPSSPEPSPASARDPHKLPNGVRLRLALGTIINDLFARQMPRPPYRYTHPPASKSSSSSSTNTSRSSPELSALPASLAPLSGVSGSKSLHAHNTPQGPPPSHVYPHRPRAPPNPTQRTLSLYSIGASPTPDHQTTAGFRCPRHLHTQCDICVEAKSTCGIGRSVPGGPAHLGAANPIRGRSDSLGQSVRAAAAVSGTGWRGTPASNGPTGGSLSGWQDGAGVGSGLSTLDIGGCTLRRKVRDRDLTTADGHDPCGAGNTKLSRLIPRFLRLSALVAVELGEEEEEEEEREAKLAAAANVGAEQLPGRATSADGVSDAGSLQGLNRLYEIAFRPTREWYLLLAGLLTRAVLEGYLTGGWRGLHAVECLLTLGLGMDHGTTNKEGDDARFEEFDPDDLPTLPDAVKLLFPSLRDVDGLSRRSAAEDEYDAEMFERLKRFYDVRQSAPDLTTLMEDIAWQYPAEPVERAALRFCEAIARWRGKPELETYKKKPVPSTPGLSSMSIESLVHSNPTSPTVHRPPSTQNSVAGSLTFAVPAPRRARHKPSIDVYFTQPAWQESPWARPGKRLRSMSSARMPENPSKRMQI